MPVFDNDDVAYVAWLAAHQHSFVINTYRRPHPGYLILHKATCKFISRTADSTIAWTSGDYVKICSESVSDLEAWCRVVTDGHPKACGPCHPYDGS